MAALTLAGTPALRVVPFEARKTDAAVGSTSKLLEVERVAAALTVEGVPNLGLDLCAE